MTSPVRTSQRVGVRLSALQPADSTRTLLRTRDEAGQVTSRVRRTVLPSGLRIISEHMAGARSASLGVWVGVGSRHEAPALHGCSHFLEHLLFKGTSTRSAMDISSLMDEVGAEFNAFTAKEYTCFHARTLGEDLPLALDVLGDMFTDALLLPEDVEAEREVILDEIAMHDDDPDDVAHNLLAAHAWGDSPLGRPIAGTVGSITTITQDRIARFYRRHYRPDNVAISVAGDVDHAQVVRWVRKAFARNDWLTTLAEPVRPRRAGRPRAVRTGQITATRAFEQVTVVLGTPGVTRSDPRRWALGVLTTALGGGTSSRLFQEVRERRGLAYSVYSFQISHADAGLVGVSVGCLPAKVDAVLDVVRGELASIAAEGLSDAEVERAKGQLRRGLVLGLEDSGSRMFRLGKAEILDDELLSLDEVAAGIEAVTPDDVRRLAAQLFTGREVLAVVGP